MDKYLDQKNPRLKTWQGKALSMFCVIAIVGGVAGARNASSSDSKLDLTENAAESDPVEMHGESPDFTDCPLVAGDTFHGSTWSYTLKSIRITNRIDEKGDDSFIATSGSTDIF